MENDRANHPDDTSQRLRWLIEDYLKIEHQDFARSINVKKSTVSNWIGNGARGLTLTGAKRICEVYGTSLDFLFMGKVDALSQQMRTAWLSRPNVNASSTSSEIPDE